MVARKSSKGTAVTLDFTTVKVFKTVPVGRHSFEVSEVTEEKGPEGPFWKITGQCLTAEGQVTNNFSFTPNALWKLKALLDAAGMDTNGVVQLKPQELVGLTFDCDVTHREYNGRNIADFGDFYPFSGEDAVCEEVPEPEEEEVENAEPEEESYLFTEEDLEDVSEEDLKAIIEELSLKVKLVGTIGAKRKAVIAALKASNYIAPEEKPEEAEEELSEESLKEASEDELREIIEQYGLTVNFIGPITVKRRTVINALKKAGVF